MAMMWIFTYYILCINLNSIKVIPNLLFYIQRSLNTNTVVYEANFDNNGILIKDNPINTHWIMYEKNGELEALSYIEKKMAYGIKCIPTNTEQQFIIQLTADKTHSFILKQLAPFKAIITTEIDGITIKLTRLFVEADNSSIWPKINYIIIEGIGQKSNKTITKQFIPTKTPL